MLSALLCALYLCSSDDCVQYSSALVPGNMEGQVASKTVEARSNTRTSCLTQETPTDPLLFKSNISLDTGGHDEMMREESTILQNPQQQQNEQPQLTSAETGAIEPATVDSTSDVNFSPHMQLHSTSIATGMYSYMHIVTNLYVCLSSLL